MPIISNFPCKIPTASQIAYDNDSSVADAVKAAQAAADAAQKQTYHSAKTGTSDIGYLAIAQITVTTAYATAPILFGLANKHKKYFNVNLCFKGANNTDPDLSYLRTDGDVGVWLHKTDNSTWELIVKVNVDYDTVYVNEFFAPDGCTTTTWLNEFYTELPTENITAATVMANNITKADMDAIQTGVADLTAAKGAANGIATLDANKKLVQMPTVADVGGVNRNMLRNWYFANPVNSKGLATYETVGAVFDGWRYWGSTTVLELTEKGVAAAASGSIYQYIQQTIDIPADLAGQTMTASVLAESLTKFHLKAFDYSEGKIGDFLGQVGGYLENGRSVLSCSFTVPSGVSRIAFLLYPNSVQTEDTVTTTFIAAKLELGEEQTLAVKNSDGEWILREIPDRAEQAAICAQYSDGNSSVSEYIGAAQRFAKVQEYSDSLTLGIDNAENFVNLYSQSDTVVTVPADSTVNFPRGTEIEVCRYWTGAVTIAAEDGVTINSVDGMRSIADVYGSVALKKIAANRWLLSGNLG